jgi:hypothetical protein
MSSISCKQCGQPITFDNKHISQRTGKKIPLDPGTNEPHDCPMRRDQPQQSQQGQQPLQQTQRRYHQCNKGCGNEVYFHEKDNTNKQLKLGCIILCHWIRMTNQIVIPAGSRLCACGCGFLIFS